MIDFSLYLMESSICLAALYSVYWIFLNNDLFFQRNRYILLGIILFSIIFPFLNFSGLNLIQQNYVEEFQNIFPGSFIENTYWENLESTSIADNHGLFKEEIFKVLISVYFIITTFFLFRLLYLLILLNKLIRKNESTTYKNYRLLNITENITPFSFFKFIFINRSKYSPTEFKDIVDHEIVHARQKHSIDLLIYELVFTLQWFNPFLWMLKKSMVETHEFLADKSIVKNRHDIINYQLLLLNQISKKRPFVLINNFNSLLIKRRIEMMIKQESKKHKQLKIFFFLPIVLLLILTFATGSEPIAINNINIGDEVVFQKPLKEGFVTSAYGMRIHPISRKKALHRGIDIAAPKGTEVYAVSPGIVSWTKEHKAAGKNILIQHANEYHTFYSQLDKILVLKGQKINAGDVIGLVGSSGLSNGPHLHFEIRKKGEAKDPEKFIDFSGFKKKR